MAKIDIISGFLGAGKTTLIKEAYQDEPYVYLFVGKKSESVLCGEFCEELQEKTGGFVPPMSAFRDVFRFLMEEGTRRKYTLVFDEFQNFLEVNPSIYSDIQNWWDKYQKESHVNMVVSGSVYSLMEKLFKDRKEPLYGRQDSTITLHAFPTSILKQIMEDIFANVDAAAKEYGFEKNYVVGANIAGFLKVVDAMNAQGIV